MDEWLTAERLDSITDYLHKRLKPQRVRHILGASHTAVRLAEQWEASASEALAAMLFHDIAKEEDREALCARIECSCGAIDPEDIEHWRIWHAHASEIMAREEFGMPSPEVARAIRLHPTGDAGMTTLEQVVFLADFIEPTRTWEGVRELRELARFDLRVAVDSAILQKTSFLRARGIALHARSRRALDDVLARTRDQRHDATVILPAPDAEGKEREEV